jgi:hypothetical protein
MPTPLSSRSPLAPLLDNQGLGRDGFRAASVLLRVAESSLPPVTSLFENQVAPS